MPHYETDALDIKILAILSRNSKISYAKIGEVLAVSAGTVHLRVKKMEEEGIIKSQQIVINPSAVGYDITTFIGVHLHDSGLYDKVVYELTKIKEVVGLNYTTGIYSMLLRVVCKDTMHLKNVLHEKIQKIEGIQRTETFISLDEPINRPINLLSANDLAELDAKLSEL